MTVRVVASGIDTLHVFTRAVVRDDVAAELTAAKERAAALPRGTDGEPIEVAGHALAVKKHGAQTAPVLLVSDHLAVRVNPCAAANLPTVATELRALYLWQRGARVCAGEAQRIAEALTVAPLPGETAPAMAVSRADLAVDFQGWEPRPEDDTRLVTRAAHRTAHRDGARFTGFMFGHGVIAARLYDKTAELRVSGKRWFHRVWAQHSDYDPHARVWRLEFQVRREALRALRIRDDRPAVQAQRADSWPELLDLARPLWRHLTTRWLAMRLPRTKRTRQRLAPEWETLSDGGFADGTWGGADADLFRDAQEVVAATTTAQLAGYLGAGLASYRYLGDPAATLAEALPHLVGRAERHAERSGRSIESRAQARVASWEAQSESMSHGSSPHGGPSPHHAERRP